MNALALPLLLAWGASPAGEGVHRFNYASENFSIALPVAWHEIDAAVLAQMPAALPRDLASSPEIKFNHAFRPSGKAGSPEGAESSGGAESGYPWVGITLTKDEVTDGKFANTNRVYGSVDELIQKWQPPALGATPPKARMSAMFYDKPRHVLWAVSLSRYSDLGDFRTISAAYITRFGTVQVHCCSKAAEYEEYRPVCREILESVTIDPRVALTAGPAGK